MIFLMLPSPINQAANSFSPSRIEPSNMREGYVRLILLLKRLAGLVVGKTPKSSREPQKSHIIYFSKECDKEQFIDRALSLQRNVLNFDFPSTRRRYFR